MAAAPPPTPDPEAGARLRAAIAHELSGAVATAVRRFAEELAARGGGGAAAVLFYGSALRTNATDGLLDFYVVLDNLAAWDFSTFARLGNRLLPPNVVYAESPDGAATLRSKVAILTLAQFRRHVRAGSYDTTIWTRFAQPAALAFVRDGAARDDVAAAVADAVRAASWWAGHLGPAKGPAADYWAGLFRRTYASELRVESATQPSAIVERAADRFALMLELGWDAEGIVFARDGDGVLTPAIGQEARTLAALGWRRRARLAKPLNLARLSKAAFTFSGGVDYVAWKIERHSGHRIELTPFQRRRPLLSALPMLWKLWRSGVLR